MLYIVIIVGLLIISYLGYKNWMGRGGEKYLIELVQQQNAVIEELTESVNLGIRIHRENIMELEKGRDEQEENYEQQFLTFEETIADFKATIFAQKETIDELEAHLAKHDKECLPLLGETRWQALSGAVENA